MVMSIGYNPFYKNTVRSAEVHVLYSFPEDFYGSEMAISILGYIRPEYDYVTVEGLIRDINEDIEVTKQSLDREKWRERLRDPYLWGEEEQTV
jgi:riboflavin kinase